MKLPPRVHPFASTHDVYKAARSGYSNPLCVLELDFREKSAIAAYCNTRAKLESGPRLSIPSARCRRSVKQTWRGTRLGPFLPASSRAGQLSFAGAVRRSTEEQGSRSSTSGGRGRQGAPPPATTAACLLRWGAAVACRPLAAGAAPAVARRGGRRPAAARRPLAPAARARSTTPAARASPPPARASPLDPASPSRASTARPDPPAPRLLGGREGGAVPRAARRPRPWIRPPRAEPRPRARIRLLRARSVLGALPASAPAGEREGR